MGIVPNLPEKLVFEKNSSLLYPLSGDLERGGGGLSRLSRAVAVNGMKRSHHVAKVMTVQYLMVLGVLAVLSFGGYAVFVSVTVGNEGSAAQVNVAGRQRMLSQRIALFAWRLAHAETESLRSEARWELENAIETMARSHKALIEGDAGLGLPGTPSAEIRSMYFGPALFVDSRLKEYLKEARAFAASEDEELFLKHQHPLLHSITGRGAELLHSLDAIVRQYQLESEGRLSLMIRLGTGGLVLTILVLGVAGVFVFAPLVRRVQKEMEELDLTRERLALAMQGTNEGIWDWDIATDTVYLSPRLRTIFRIDENDRFLGGKDWVANIHKDDRPGYLAALRTHLKGRTAFFVAEYRLRRGEGEFRWVRQRGLALRRDDGRCYRMAGSVGDVTERRRNEEDLRLAASVFAGSPEAVMITDAKTRILDVNPAFTAVTGYTKGEILGEPPSLLSSGRHDDAFYSEMWQALNENDFWEGEIWNVRKSGETFPEYLRISVLRDQEGAVMNYIGQFSDITRTKEDQEQLARNTRELASRSLELEQALVRANQANRAKSEFLAAMSHELRTPLNAVIGFSEAMLTQVFGPVGDQRYEGYLKNIRESGRHLLDVINDILDVSKVEAGKIDLLEEPVDVAACIESTLRLVRERAEGEGVSLEVQLPAELPTLFADERRIKQVMLNLVSNAVKFTNPGGHVTVTADSSKDEGLWISVADTGIGIAEEDLARVLTPFTQVDSQLARKYEGTGLGLPLTKGLVEAHGGSLEIESELRKGTTVTIRFPENRLVLEAVYSI